MQKDFTAPCRFSSGDFLSDLCSPFPGSFDLSVSTTLGIECNCKFLLLGRSCNSDETVCQEAEGVVYSILEKLESCKIELLNKNIDPKQESLTSDQSQENSSRNRFLWLTASSASPAPPAALGLASLVPWERAGSAPWSAVPGDGWSGSMGDTCLGSRFIPALGACGGRGD